MATVIDDDEHLRVFGKFGEQVGVGLCADVLHGGAAQSVEKCGRFWGNFAHVFKAAIEAVFGLHGWLGGGAHDDRTMIVLRQFFDGTFHQTTLMCAKHRSQKLDEIRGRLKNGEPCRVIATSLIEAGVDVDFPLVMRAEAGLDSVAQAAGRCNREGKRPSENSFVWIFAPEEQWKAPPELAAQAAVMRLTADSFSDDLLSTQAVAAYFAELYQLKGSELDNKKILKMHNDTGQSLDFPFQTIADKFRMIESHMQPLIIPFDVDAESLISSLHHADHIGGLLRKLQPYTVQIPEKALAALYKAGRIEPINEKNFGKQFYTLIGLDLYDEVAGLSWEDTEFLKGESLVF